MTHSTLSILAIIAAVALVGALGVTVTATSDGSDGDPGGFLRHLHKLGHHLHHGAGHHHGSMSRMIDQLELTPDQLRHLEKIHEILGSHGSETPGSMVELHGRLVAQFEQGHVETDELRVLIDDHVEQIREMAYDVTDELIALVNGLDARQRAIVLTHLQGNQGKPDSQGP